MDPGEPTARTRRVLPRWAWAAIVLASLLTWWPTWNEPLAEDDFLFLEVVSRQEPAALLGYFGSEGVMDHHYRPLSDPVWYAFATTAPRYHVGLQLLHALAALLVFSLGAACGLSAGGALAGALLWATRDCGFPAMIWASGYPDVGSTLLALASLRLYARSRESGSMATRACSVIVFVAAVLTKETAVVTLALLPIVDRLGPRGAPGGRGARDIAWRMLPFFACGVPIALVQVAFAHFADAYGQSLYALSVGLHTLWLWPVYALWSFLALPAAASTPLRIATVAAGALLLGGALARGARTPEGRRTALLGFGWFTAAILPALLAPARINTNYALLASVGPCLAAGSLLARGLRRGGAAKVLAGSTLALLLVAGPLLVAAKDRGKIGSGGWVEPARAREANLLVDAIARRVLPDPPRDATLAVFGAVELNPMLLANLGQGFGPQSGLQSAFRRAYGRADVRVATLPSIEETLPGNLDALRRQLALGPEGLRVLDAGPPAVDLTSAAIAAAASAANVEEFRGALAAARAARGGAPGAGSLRP